MPTFGSFETIGSPHAETQARDHSNTVWRARKVGSKDDQIYAIKVFSSADRRPLASHGEQDLDADPGLEFIETLKQHKKAAEISQRLLVPIHEFGTVPQGAWYVTDFYRRGSLKVWVTLRGKVDAAALRNVVGSALHVCKLLKETHGRSHGNLKISNVFLGGKTQPLGGTPLLFADALIIPSRSITNLQGRDRHAVQGMIHDTFEVQDLRAIGEMIWQLVTGRLIESAADYNYPVERSKEWERLGREGEKWRKLCEDLVNPHLSLETINLELLSRQFQPTSSANVPWLAISLVVGVFFFGGGAYLFRGAIFPKHKAIPSSPAVVKTESQQPTANPQETSPKPSEADQKAAEAADINKKYQMAMMAGRQAVADRNYDEAERQATIAWGLKLGDQAASQLLADAKAGKAQAMAAETAAATAAKADQGYKVAMSVGTVALADGKYDDAIAQAGIALGIRPGDDAATKLKNGATAGQTAALAAADNERKYKAAMSAGTAAISGAKYDDAIAQAGIALGIKPRDDAATKLKSDAAAGKVAALAAADNERKYKAAMSAGTAAISGAKYDDAIAQAGIALGIKPRDDAATKLKNDAAAGKAVALAAADNEQKYTAAMKAGQTALQAKNYDDAIAQAGKALVIKPRDDAATKLKSDATAGKVAALAAADDERKYKAAMSAGTAAISGAKYDDAIAQAGIALGIKPRDDAATKLKSDATAGKVAALAAADNERKYTTALKAGQTALQAKNYDDAIAQAGIALAIRPGDDAATKLKNDAAGGQAAAENERNYQAAMTAGQTALQSKNYAEAIRQAGIALGLKSGDDAATKLNNEAKIGVNQQNFQQAIQAGQNALNQGNRDEAVRFAEQTFAANPTNQAAITLRADAYSLRTLDQQLQDLMKRFDVSAKGNTINPKLSNKKEEPSGIDLGSRQAALKEAADLLNNYKAHPGWLTPERQKALSEIPSKINNWE